MNASNNDYWVSSECRGTLSATAICVSPRSLASWWSPLPGDVIKSHSLVQDFGSAVPGFSLGISEISVGANRLEPSGLEIQKNKKKQKSQKQ